MLSGQNLMILMFFLICFSSCSQIVDFQTNQTLTFNTFKQFKSKTPQLKEYLLFPGSINPKKLNTCEKLDPTEFGANFSFAGAAVIVFGYNKCSFEKHARLVQDQGGSVAIVASGLPFNEAHFRFGKVEDLKIPIYFVTINDAIKILQTIGKNAALGAPTFLRLSDANNTWFNIGKGGYWIFLETIVLLGYLINFILGARSIILHIKEEGFKPTIGQITLWVNMAGLVIFSMLVFDPWNLRYIASEKFVVTMLCLFAPALLTSILLMGFFFNEVLISKGFMKPQLNYLKYPFLVICLTCWAAYFADFAFLVQYAVNLDVIKTVVLMNVLFFSLASIYFVCVTILILLKLSRFSSPILKRLAPLVSFIIFGIVLFIIAAIIDAEQVFSGYEARKMIAVWSLYWISSLFIYTPQFIYFREPFSKTQSKLSSEKLSKSSNKLIHLSS